MSRDNGEGSSTDRDVRTDGRGPPEEPPGQSDDPGRGPPRRLPNAKAARKQARKMGKETRVHTRKRNGSQHSVVLVKQRDKTKGGANVKVFKG